jgi:hypothetical protein
VSPTVQPPATVPRGTEPGRSPADRPRLIALPGADGAAPAGRAAAPDAAHRSSHLHLLSAVPSYDPGPATARLRLSAVIVPTHRPLDSSGDGLGLAVRCAEAEDAQLIVLRSGPAARSPIPRSLAPSTSAPALVIDLPEAFTPVFAGHTTSTQLAGSLYRAGDLSDKRNLGLLLGVLCGWEAALFLDDDIGTTRYWRATSTASGEVHPLLRLDDVLADLATYPDLQAVGYLSQDFRDNSVVCHARHLTGLPQDQFIGGGATVVRCGPRTPFFPAAYNEDWLFFFALMIDGRHRLPSSAVKTVGPVYQRPYYPFSPLRARSEELGDVLAEGLLSLMTRPRSEILALACASAYWEGVVRQRQDMVLDVLQHLRLHSDASGTEHRDATESLIAALSVYRHGSIPDWAGELSSYVHGYLLDIDTWHDLLAGLAPKAPPDVLSVPDALALAGLGSHTTGVVKRGLHHRVERPVRPAQQVSPAHVVDGCGIDGFRSIGLES